MRDPNFLQTVWFLLICVLWLGYFILEGFDFGVGILLKKMSRDDVDRRMVIHTIGPVWDGNEVWLLVAGGATFAAFPGWYASLFSGFYLALFLVLAALIMRGIAFEYWGKHDTRRWRSGWEWSLAGGSFLAALLWGVAWANIVRGVPMNANHDVTGSLFDLLNPYGLMGGLVTLALFTAHGAVFLALRTKDEMEQRALTAARATTPVAAALVAVFVIWTFLEIGTEPLMVATGVLAIAAAAAAPLTLARGSAGWSFAATAGAIALVFITLFAALFPNALPSTTDSTFTLTLVEAASTQYTLKVMTVVAVMFVPVVLVYQGWTYWVFRHRLGRDDFEGPLTPLTALEKLGGGEAKAKG